MQVSNSVVAGFVGVLVVLVGAVGFLLGRESAQTAHPPAPVAAPAPTPPPEVQPMPVEPPAAQRADAAVVASPKSGAREVREYFAELAAIQSAAGFSGDANELANQLLTAAMNGDSSGFDAMIASAQAGTDKIRGMRVPAACQSYHQKTLALLGDGVQLLRKLKAAIERQDAEAMGSLAGSAGSLQSRTDALQAEERSIKSRFGL